MHKERAGEEPEGGNLSRKRVFEDVNHAEFNRVVPNDAVSARKKLEQQKQNQRDTGTGRATPRASTK